MWRENIPALTLALALASRADAAPPWPPFLPEPSAFSPGIIASVEHVWAEATFHRAVTGAPVDIPFRTYLAFVDAPDVTAAAARHLKLARYDVHVLDDNWYQADDHDGAQGMYRVLMREPTRRVVLSWGTHSGNILGTIRGRALSVMDFEQRGAQTEPKLTAYVLIENRAAAALARLLVPVFGTLVDRKLSEGFRVTAQVAEWAIREPGQFCDWLEREPVPPVRRAQIGETVPECTLASAGVTPRP